MTNGRPPERAALSEWVVESLRATAFPSADAQVNANNWWRNVLGEDPETRVVRPRLGELQDHGPFRGAKLTLRVHPTRIDWILASGLPETEPPAGFPTIGSFEETCPHFHDLISRWFPLSPALERLAFGAIALLPLASQSDGYLRLSAYLPAVQLDPVGSSDFFYQVNRPRSSRCKIKGLRINRLSKWSVARMEFKALVLGRQEELRVIGGEGVFSCRVELDVNTSPDFDGDFASDQSTEIFGELLDLGREILKEGDRP